MKENKLLRFMFVDAQGAWRQMAKNTALPKNIFVLFDYDLEYSFKQTRVNHKINLQLEKVKLRVVAKNKSC